MSPPENLRTTCGLFLVLAMTISSGCAASRSLSDLPDSIVTGHYTEDAEGQWFQPCVAPDEDRRWWVTFTDRAVTQRGTPPFADLLTGDGRAFVRWRAALGDREQGAPAGPGPASRYALVRDILEVRPAAWSDCGTP